MMKAKAVVLVLTGCVTLGMADGAAIYERCAVCHGEYGEKKSLGVSAVIAGWKEDKIIERIKGYQSKKLNQYGFGNMMSGQAVKLTDSQAHEVAAYISKLTPPQVQDEATDATDEILTPEQIEYRQFVRDYFVKNPQYGNIREANRLWEEKKAKESGTK